MAIECKNTTSSIWWQQWRWPKLLRIAKANGWKPAGTTQSPEDEIYFPGGRWDRDNYTTNDGQTVTAEDAIALGAALESALRVIPNEYALAKYELPGGGIEIAPNQPPVPDVDWFSGAEAKAQVAAFVAFCKQGAFRIF
ncbi:MAG TPA: hypothetical protein VGG19_04840 [Tepidisphaeraceae bacterium]|jgi:hypothetical protein